MLQEASARPCSQALDEVLRATETRRRGIGRRPRTPLAVSGMSRLQPGATPVAAASVPCRGANDCQKTVSRSSPTGAWRLRWSPSGSRHRPIVSGARLAAQTAASRWSPHTSTRRCAFSPETHGKTKRPRPQSRGRFGVRSGLCGCPEHHGRICQVAAQAKPCLLTGGGIRRGFIFDSSGGAVGFGPVGVSSSGRDHYWTPLPVVEAARVAHSWR